MGLFTTPSHLYVSYERRVVNMEQAGARIPCHPPTDQGIRLGIPICLWISLNTGAGAVFVRSGTGMGFIIAASRFCAVVLSVSESVWERVDAVDDGFRVRVSGRSRRCWTWAPASGSRSFFFTWADRDSGLAHPPSNQITARPSPMRKGLRMCFMAAPCVDTRPAILIICKTGWPVPMT